ncbi:MAG: hypothetical protein HOE90_16595 [Bacteriovoracaceae bacterium]|jgi:hypothetical protein|nr:hypothetical protein [Bacteriovoracaceae bacterium]
MDGIKLMRMFSFLILITFSFPLLAKWKKHYIPGARCGDGRDYFVYIKRGDPKKLAFVFMGGGACWNHSTCFGLNRRAWMHPIPIMTNFGGMTSSNPEFSPITKHTSVFFPYCTGDVHVGTHVAKYGLRKAYHVGALNFNSALEYFKRDGAISIDKINDFFIYGYSAGAIGAIYHATKMNKIIPKHARKTLIADAPGLHFGKSFWKKFPKRYLKDIDAALGIGSFERKVNNGNVSGLIPKLCSILSDWQVGVLQGSRDIVMSEVFGEINRKEHEKLIFGAGGLYQSTLAGGDNCSAWIPKSEMHTFFTISQTTRSIFAGTKSASEYVFDVMDGIKSKNYR